MSFADDLFADRFPVSLEITPPQKPTERVLLRRAGLLGSAAAAINVVQRPGRQSSLEASRALRAAGFQPAWHLVTRGRARDEIVAEIDTAAEAGIDLVLTIRGDHAAAEGDHPAMTIRETLALLHERLPGAITGATFNQHLADVDASQRNLAGKLRAGARYVQTQPIFDLGTSAPALEAVRQRNPEARIVAMAMPLVTREAAERVTTRLGIPIPPTLSKRLHSESEAWTAFDELLAALFESPIIDGVAIMTFEMDAPPEAGARITEALVRAGIHRANRE